MGHGRRINYFIGGRLVGGIWGSRLADESGGTDCNASGSALVLLKGGLAASSRGLDANAWASYV